MTKGVHSGKQDKKGARHQAHSKPEPIQKKDDVERRTEDTASDEEHAQNKVEAETIKPPREVEKQNRRERFREWANKWSNVLLIVVPSVFSVLVLAAILLQAYIYEKQWISMQASIEETKRNRELEYRSYIGVKTARLVPQKDSPDFGMITVTIFNSGRTPGVGWIKATMSIQDESPSEDAPVPNPQSISRIVFAPLVDVNSRVSAFPVGRVVSPSPGIGERQPKPSPTPSPSPTPVSLEGRFAKPGQLEIYVYGYIEYQDIFYKTHWTKFCVYNVPGTDIWTFCPTFNDSN